MGLPAAPFRDAVDVVRATIRIGSSRRYRAANRHRLHDAAEHSSLLIILASLLDLAFLLPSDAELWINVATNAGVAGIALAAYVALRERRHVPPEPLILGLLLVVDLAVAYVGRVDAAMLPVCAGYTLLLPGIVAVVVPWRTRFHVGWLALHMGWAIAGVAVLGVPFPVDRPGIMLTLLILAVGLSVYGHVMNLRARTLAFEQVQHIASLNRAGRRAETTLRQLNRILESMARTDELTGLRNRLSLGEEMPLVRARIDRSGDRYALLMLDVDHFKAINDQLGHFAGDQVLRQIAVAVRRATRDADACFRFGGEEFLVIAPLTHGETDAFPVAERVRRQVEALAIPHPGNAPFRVVTISIGAAVVGRSALGLASDDWFRLVDDAMYLAKARGRNCVVAVEADASEPRISAEVGVA